MATTAKRAPRPTLAEADEMIRAAGYTATPAGSWEDEDVVFAFSRECAAPGWGAGGTMGHPLATVRWKAGRLELTTYPRG